jgi:hypothetical protein
MQAEDGRTKGSAAQRTRQFLRDQGGRCTRQKLLEYLNSDPDVRTRHDRPRAFAKFIFYMKNSGFIWVTGDEIELRELGRENDLPRKGF